MILCEAKFYAGLTINQPNTYLDRLKKENGLGLVFICPAARKITLWSKLIELCEHRKLEKNDKKNNPLDIGPPPLLPSRTNGRKG